MTQPNPPLQSQRKIDAGKIPGAAEITNCVEIKLKFSWVGRTVIDTCILHGRNNGTVTVNKTLADVLFTSLSGSWANNIALLLTPNISFNSVHVRDMTSKDNPEFISTPTDNFGTSASPELPRDVAIVLTENVNVRGRGAKGRVYLGGWCANAAATAGTIASSTATSVNALGTA